MNAVFAVITLVSVAYLAVVSPESVMASLNGGAEKGIKLCFTLLIVYSVWLGLYEILDRSGATETAARLLSKPINALFGETDDQTRKYLSMNVTANMLGLGSVATTTGIKAAERLQKAGNKYACAILFVLAATSVQLLPATVISLRAQAGAASPTDIVLPTLLSTAVSTVCGVLLTKIFVKR